MIHIGREAGRLLTRFALWRAPTGSPNGRHAENHHNGRVKSEASPTVLPKHVSIVLGDPTNRLLSNLTTIWEDERTPRVVEHALDQLGNIAYVTFALPRPREITPRIAASIEQVTLSLAEKDIRIRFRGDKTTTPKEFQKAIEKAENTTRNKSGQVLVLTTEGAWKYDVVEATRNLTLAERTGSISLSQVSDDTLERILFEDSGIPQVDLFIHMEEAEKPVFIVNDGESADYAEHVVQTHSFASLLENPTILQESLEEFARRQRRFGGLPNSNGSGNGVASEKIGPFFKEMDPALAQASRVAQCLGLLFDFPPEEVILLRNRLRDENPPLLLKDALEALERAEQVLTTGYGPEYADIFEDMYRGTREIPFEVQEELANIIDSKRDEKGKTVFGGWEWDDYRGKFTTKPPTNLSSK